MDEDPASETLDQISQNIKTKNEKSKDYCIADLKQRVFIKNNRRCFNQLCSSLWTSPSWLQ